LGRFLLNAPGERGAKFLTPLSIALGYMIAAILWSAWPKGPVPVWTLWLPSLWGLPAILGRVIGDLPAIGASALLVFVTGWIASRRTVHGKCMFLKRRYEDRLARQAQFDQLTGLPNHLLALDRLSQAMKQGQRAGQSVTLMRVDIDRLKDVNDSLGHTVGDAVLVEAGGRLSACVRKTDTVARLGSDEFLVILAEPVAGEPSDVVARRVLEAFSHPFHTAGRELFISVSIGLAIAPEDGAEPRTLLQNGSVALSLAREAGRNSYRFFTPGMNQQAAQRLEIETNLRHALERSELSLVYQPVLDLASNRMTGAEALLRWHSPSLGTVPPDRFIPLAEDTGLIVPIGAWVVREACHEARRWMDQGWTLSVAVNMSPRQLRHPHLVDDVKQALADSGLPADRLELEVTESYLIEDPQRTAEVLKELNGLGIRLSIDDFGTGYSSLSYLNRYPFQTLKIDRSFIRDTLLDPGQGVLVKAIIALGKELRLRVVAEGVETAEQLGFLRDHGCDVAQGYHVSRPLAPPQADDFARRFAGGPLPSGMAAAGHRVWPAA